MAWEKELTVAIAAARAAGARLKELALNEKEILSAKGRDIKLQADRDSEAIILKMLAEGSEHPVLAEESGEVGEVPGGGTGCFWAVDPLDGTYNFSRGVPVCGVSIALVDGTEPVLGVFYDFNRDDLMYGVVGGEARWNEEPLKVSQTTEIGQAILATGFPVNRDFSDEALEKFMHEVRPFKKVRMVGSAATSLGWVACGRFDVYMEDDIMLWDVAAGIAMVRAAGGIVQLAPSQKLKWARHVRAAANQGLLDAVPSE